MNNSEFNPTAKMPSSYLAWQLIRAYLKQKGYSLEQVGFLPENQQKELMTAANMHASLKLAEIEALSNLRHKIHNRA